MAKTVATPLEQEINGVDDMLYMTSQSTSDGSARRDHLQARDQSRYGAGFVQNRVATALPRLPEEVRSIGVTANKTIA